jgi:hypothetical protein
MIEIVEEDGSRRDSVEQDNYTRRSQRGFTDEKGAGFIKRGEHRLAK